jgi:homoserine dehydrogenase
MDGVFGTVVAEGDFVGRVMLWKAAALSTAPSVPMSAHVGAYYLRLMVVDRPGVIADVTAILRDMGVSLESMLQRGRSPGEAVPVVLVTHETQESAMRWTGSVRWTQ